MGQRDFFEGFTDRFVSLFLIECDGGRSGFQFEFTETMTSQLGFARLEQKGADSFALRFRFDGHLTQLDEPRVFGQSHNDRQHRIVFAQHRIVTLGVFAVEFLGGQLES